MIKIIKKDGKYYRQEIEEFEITLEELQEEFKQLKADKIRQLDNQTKMHDDRIVEVENLIAQIKTL